ncbi:MAG: hypothetical protein NT034_01395 [Candidatus Magasanikbacteria bacterium]|nr:hypothetical protein [Candidatus Magasanikbacteria bacterium]
MRRNLDNIEIVEPPIEELTKKRSWKGACFTSCALLLVLLVGIGIGIKVYVGPGPQNLKSVPDNFPSDILVYDKNNIETITYISARYKQRGLGIATLLPKLILAPVFYNSQNNDAGGALKNIWNIVSAPSSDNKDSVQIEWTSVEADPDFIISYYKKELRKKNFKIEVQSQGDNVQQFSFTREDGISGSVYASNSDDKQFSTDHLLLTVNIPIK